MLYFNVLSTVIADRCNEQMVTKACVAYHKARIVASRVGVGWGCRDEGGGKGMASPGDQASGCIVNICGGFHTR